ncbi:PIN domain-containing protein [Methylomonas rosea]|uniref:PIN domain-containing protein n=1 Tax=Methylomonas rosea TaxID=2952227 RepID=A0ABT1TU29_9GAMM|nr:PIN domain-containing protein [Methylomonas sp. WSC-7]MCQ8118088.1 PIN domain-containing protein [Methylomonas sp. WSC-7]
MKTAKTFIDTNVLLYVFSGDSGKADRAEAILQTGGCVSVQVLNEFTSVAKRKFNMSYPEIREALQVVKTVCQILPLTLEIHEQGLDIAERFGFSMYDSLIVAAALLAGCTTLYSEDLQHGQLIQDQLLIVNPFADPVD